MGIAGARREARTDLVCPSCPKSTPRLWDHTRLGPGQLDCHTLRQVTYLGLCCCTGQFR